MSTTQGSTSPVGVGSAEGPRGRRPLRILHINHLLDLGGSEVMMLDLAREQKRAGHDVHIGSMYGEGALDGKARGWDLPVHHLRSGPSLGAQVAALRAHLRAHPVDILHSHWGVWLPASLAAFSTRTPLVHTHHANQMRRLFPKHRVATLFTRRVVVVTPEIDEYIAKWVNVPRRKIRCIPNGIDLSRLLGAHAVEIEGIPSGATVVGMVARLSPPKDQITFIRAAKLLEAKFPDVHFIAVGDGKNRPLLEGELASLPAANVHLLGDRLDVPDLLRRMTIKVLATRNEGLPISLLEAMASGCACVATDIPPNRFALQNGEAGVLVPGADPAALAAAIERLLNDPDERGRLAAAGKAFAETLTSERMAGTYLELYRTLVPASKLPGREVGFRPEA